MTGNMPSRTWTQPAPPSPAILQHRRMHHTWIGALVAVAMFLFAGPILAYEEVFEWLGYPFLLAGVLGRMVASMYIGGRKSATVIATGPYSVVRNPLYVCSLSGVIGVGLVTGMLTLLALFIATFLLYYRDVVRREERHLEQTFGDEYRAYKRRVPRWLPKPWLWQSPETIEVRPRHVWVTLRDVAWFLAFLPAVELWAYLRAIGLIPVLYRLY